MCVFLFLKYLLEQHPLSIWEQTGGNYNDRPQQFPGHVHMPISEHVCSKLAAQFIGVTNKPRPVCDGRDP